MADNIDPRIQTILNNRNAGFDAVAMTPAVAPVAIQTADDMTGLEKAWAEHETAIKSVELALKGHAEEAAKSASPLRLAALRDVIRAHTNLLHDLIVKYPVPK